MQIVIVELITVHTDCHTMWNYSDVLFKEGSKTPAVGPKMKIFTV